MTIEVPTPDVVHTPYHTLGMSFTRQDVHARNQSKQTFVNEYRLWRQHESGCAAPQSSPRCPLDIEIDMPKLPARTNEAPEKKREGSVIATPPSKGPKTAIDSPVVEDDLMDDWSDTTSVPGVPRA